MSKEEPRRLTPEEVLCDPAHTKCKCSNADCPRHGDCKSCTAWHRYRQNLPLCMRPYAQVKPKG